MEMVATFNAHIHVSNLSTGEQLCAVVEVRLVGIFDMLKFPRPMYSMCGPFRGRGPGVAMPKQVTQVSAQNGICSWPGVVRDLLKMFLPVHVNTWTDC